MVACRWCHKRRWRFGRWCGGGRRWGCLVGVRTRHCAHSPAALEGHTRRQARGHTPRRQPASSASTTVTERAGCAPGIRGLSHLLVFAAVAAGPPRAFLRLGRSRRCAAAFYAARTHSSREQLKQQNSPRAAADDGPPQRPPRHAVAQPNAPSPTTSRQDAAEATTSSRRRGGVDNITSRRRAPAKAAVPVEGRPRGARPCRPVHLQKDDQEACTFLPFYKDRSRRPPRRPPRGPRRRRRLCRSRRHRRLHHNSSAACPSASPPTRRRRPSRAPFLMMPRRRPRRRTTF